MKSSNIFKKIKNSIKDLVIKNKEVITIREFKDYYTRHSDHKYNIKIIGTLSNKGGKYSASLLPQIQLMDSKENIDVFAIKYYSFLDINTNDSTRAIEKFDEEKERLKKEITNKIMSERLYAENN